MLLWPPFGTLGQEGLVHFRFQVQFHEGIAYNRLQVELRGRLPVCRDVCTMRVELEYFLNFYPDIIIR